MKEFNGVCNNCGCDDLQPKGDEVNGQFSVECEGCHTVIKLQGKLFIVE